MTMALKKSERNRGTNFYSSNFLWHEFFICFGEKYKSYVNKAPNRLLLCMIRWRKTPIILRKHHSPSENGVFVFFNWKIKNHFRTGCTIKKFAKYINQENFLYTLNLTKVQIDEPQKTGKFKSISTIEWCVTNGSEKETEELSKREMEKTELDFHHVVKCIYIQKLRSSMWVYSCHTQTICHTYQSWLRAHSFLLCVRFCHLFSISSLRI